MLDWAAQKKMLGYCKLKKISEYNQIALDAMRAKNLFSFVKRAREVFGESTLLVGSKTI